MHRPTRSPGGRHDRPGRHARPITIVLVAAIIAAAVTAVAVAATATNDGPSASVAAATFPPARPGGHGAPPGGHRTDAADRDAGGDDPGLTAALEAAAVAAAADGIRLTTNDTHRSAEEQDRLFAEEVARTGSVDAALGRVFPADRSMHVRGLAADLGSGPAADWLERHGGAFGLCRTLDWEWWHFEWRAEWQRTASCPAPAASPAEAPTS